MTVTYDVVVPWHDSGCDARARAWRWTRARLAATLASPIIGHDDSSPFNIAAALNSGARRSKADVLVLTGADVVIRTEHVERAVAAVAVQGRWAMLADQYLRLNRATSDSVLALPVDATLSVNLPGKRMRAKVGWGPIVIGREMLLGQLGGYDERFRGWGWEDDAFGIAATALCGPPVRIGATALMLWHPREDRRDHPHYEENRALIARYRATDDVPALLAERPPAPPCGFRSMGLACSLPAGHEYTSAHALVGAR